LTNPVNTQTDKTEKKQRHKQTETGETITSSAEVMINSDVRLFQPHVDLSRVTAWLHLRFNFVSNAIRTRYDHSTTYVTTAGLPVCGLLHCDLNK